MENTLAQKKCKPCEGGVKALEMQEIEALLLKVPNWSLSIDRKEILREFKLKSFVECVNLINKIKDIAEAENHHPDIHLENYKVLLVELSTHAVGGLTENDFILAAKIDEVTKDIKSPKNEALDTLKP